MRHATRRRRDRPSPAPRCTARQGPAWGKSPRCEGDDAAGRSPWISRGSRTSPWWRWPARGRSLWSSSRSSWDFCRASHSIRARPGGAGGTLPRPGGGAPPPGDPRGTSRLNESITGRGELNPDRYPELRRIASELFTAREDLERTLRGLINSPRLEQALQEKVFTSRNDRYVLLVKTATATGPGTVHDVSASGATCYIEPGGDHALNNRVRMLEGSSGRNAEDPPRPLPEGRRKRPFPRGQSRRHRHARFPLRRGPLQH